MERRLIVNADDFGLSLGINRGIVEAHERGIVTSASLMVRWPATAEAAAYARRVPALGLGLHVDLGEWTYREGAWHVVYEVVPSDNEEAIRTEVLRQLDQFRSLLGRDPTHLDSHQHIHRQAPVELILINLAAELGVPLRHFHPEIRYCGDFYGQDGKGWPCPEAIAVTSLQHLIHALPAGTTELACHPGYADDLESKYRTERALEVATLCDPRVREQVQAAGIRLCSFADPR